jgi:hypothetical protein
MFVHLFSLCDMKVQHLNICTKIINKTINKHPYRLDNPSKLHYTFLFDGLKLINYGVNYTNKRFPFNSRNGNIHSEVNCLTNTNLNNLTFSQLTLINFRVNNAGNFRNSKPCDRCQSFIDRLGLSNKVWHTIDNGIAKWKF